MITEKIVKLVAPECKNVTAITDALNKTLVKFDITQKGQIASFLANTAHESAGFNVFEENLNYSREGLLNTFKKYFDKTTAVRFARNKEGIANTVYANRLGNGNFASGDGWKFRGVGGIQCTGRGTHQAFADYMHMTLDAATAYMRTIEGAMMSAGWFWKYRASKNLNDVTKNIPQKKISFVSNGVSDCREFDLSCRIINGGVLGYSDRLTRYNKIIMEL